jgi:hypothetical protein
VGTAARSAAITDGAEERGSDSGGGSGGVLAAKERQRGFGLAARATPRCGRTRAMPRREGIQKRTWRHYR